MEMKGLMFAGAGLFVAMTATMMLMSGDIAKMQEQERAKQAERCAAAAAEAGAAAPATTPDMSYSDASAQAPAADGAAPDDEQLANCPETADAATTPVAEGTPAVDPNMPMTNDPNAAGTTPTTTPQLDPMTGEPITDPARQSLDQDSFEEDEGAYPTNGEPATTTPDGSYDPSDDEFAGADDAPGGTTYVPEGDGLATSGF